MEFTQRRLHEPFESCWFTGFPHGIVLHLWKPKDQLGKQSIVYWPHLAQLTSIPMLDPKLWMILPHLSSQKSHQSRIVSRYLSPSLHSTWSMQSLRLPSFFLLNSTTLAQRLLDFLISITSNISLKCFWTLSYWLGGILLPLMWFDWPI